MEDETDWDTWCPLACMSYNTSVNEGTLHSPRELLFGKLAKLPIDIPLNEGEQLPTYNDYLVNLVTKLVKLQQLAHDKLVKAKERSKVNYEKKK